MVISNRSGISELVENINDKRMKELLDNNIIPSIKTGKKKKNYHTTSDLLDLFMLLAKNEADANGFAKTKTYLLQHDLTMMKILAPNLEKLATVLSISNQKGGVGKTTTSVNLAALLATKLNQRVLIVDMDVQSNASTFFIKEEEGAECFEDKNISELFSMQNRGHVVTKEDVRKNITSFRDFVDFGEDGNFGEDAQSATLDVLASVLDLDESLAVARVQNMTHTRLDKILNTVKDDYDFIIIDTPPSLGTALDMGIYAADFVALCSEATKLSKKGLMITINSMNALQRDIEKDIRLDALFVNDFTNVNVQGDKLSEIYELAMDNDIDIEKIFKVQHRTLMLEAEALNMPAHEHKKDVGITLEIIEPLIKYATMLLQSRAGV